MAAVATTAKESGLGSAPIQSNSNPVEIGFVSFDRMGWRIEVD